MKKIKNITLILTLLIITSCSTRSGKVGNVNPNDITYFQDARTELCYGIIGAKQGKNLIDESTSIGMACVPCNDKVLKIINNE